MKSLKAFELNAQDAWEFKHHLRQHQAKLRSIKAQRPGVKAMERLAHVKDRFRHNFQSKR